MKPVVDLRFARFLALFCFVMGFIAGAGICWTIIKGGH